MEANRRMAEWCDEITLIATKAGGERVNENGFENEPEEISRRTVFCNEKSVGYSEFLKAQQAGVTESLKCDVKSADYEGEILAEYKGMKYSILRGYKLNDDEIELTLSDLRQQNE